MLLSTAYCPPVSYLALIARGMVLSPEETVPARVFVEAFETYPKQSYRNRCYILGPNGKEMLQVPVVHGGPTRTGLVRVDYSKPWVLRTCRAIDTAYSSAAFYEHYRDGLFAILESRPETLMALNGAILQFLLEKTGVAAEVVPTTQYFPEAEDDYREVIHPKRLDTVLRDLGLEKPYYQVFSEKFGFTPGLSALDLLFNEGPDSILWLKR